jgi:hypothetical protein
MARDLLGEVVRAQAAVEKPGVPVGWEVQVPVPALVATVSAPFVEQKGLIRQAHPVTT